MADNVAVTAGAGQTIHADEYTHATLGSGKTQLVKLVDGTLDASTAIAAGTGVAAGALRTTLATDVGLPAGTSNIGDVDVLTVNGVAPAFGTGVRGATVQRVTIATDDVVPVSAASLPLPSGASTLAEQQTQTTALQLIDDSVATVAAAITTKGLAAVGTDGTNARILKTDTSGELQVDVLTLPNVTIGAAIPAGTNNIGDVDVLTINGVAPAFGTGVRGATVQRVTIATDDSLPVTNAGTFAVQESGGVLTALQIMDDWDNTASDGASVSGDVAHDGVDAGEPVKIGGKAISAEPTAVAAADRVNALFDLVGKLIVLPYANPENFVSGTITTAMTATTSTSLVAAPAAGLRNYITSIVVSNAHATVGTDVIIQDGSAGTTLMVIPAAAVYGGAVINLSVPLRQPTTATAIFCANVTTGASTKVSAVGYKGI